MHSGAHIHSDYFTQVVKDMVHFVILRAKYEQSRDLLLFIFGSLFA